MARQAEPKRKEEKRESLNLKRLKLVQQERWRERG